MRAFFKQPEEPEEDEFESRARADELKKSSKFFKDIDEKSASAKAKAEESITDAVSMLLPLEKKTRLDRAPTAAIRVCSCILSLCRDGAHWKDLNAYIILLSKRRQALKQVI